jgi:DNA mismatch repair ATPase MutS
MLGTALVFFVNGLPVPCESARIYPFSRLLTHFPAEENFVGEGRLQNELKRLESILGRSDGETVVMLNETFSGTYEEKAVELTVKTAKDFLERNSFGIFVTHQRGVYNKAASVPGISFLETAPEESGRFKIRKITGIPGSGMFKILKKYGLAKAQLEERVGGAV